MLGGLGQGEQPRVAERPNLLQQHGDLRHADLQPLRALAAARKHLLLAVRLGEETVCSACRFEPGQVGVGLEDSLLVVGLGGDDRLLGLLAGAGQLASPWFSMMRT